MKLNRMLACTAAAGGLVYPLLVVASPAAADPSELTATADVDQGLKPSVRVTITTTHSSEVQCEGFMAKQPVTGPFDPTTNSEYITNQRVTVDKPLTMTFNRVSAGEWSVEYFCAPVGQLPPTPESLYWSNIRDERFIAAASGLPAANRPAMKVTIDKVDPPVDPTPEPEPEPEAPCTGSVCLPTGS